MKSHLTPLLLAGTMSALMMMAGRTFKQRVEMHVAIALGASVQPFTKITPRVSKTVMARMGFEAISCTNIPNETSKVSLSRMM